MQRIESRRPREEREVYNKMRVFARFHSPEEHEEFVQGAAACRDPGCAGVACARPPHPGRAGLIEEMRLQQRIAVLQEYRRRGVRTLAEAEEYEQTRKRQALEQQQFRQRQREWCVPAVAAIAWRRSCHRVAPLPPAPSHPRCSAPTTCAKAPVPPLQWVLPDPPDPRAPLPVTQQAREVAAPRRRGDWPLLRASAACVWRTTVVWWWMACTCRWRRTRCRWTSQMRRAWSS